MQIIMEILEAKWWLLLKNKNAYRLWALIPTSEIYRINSIELIDV